MKSKQEIRDWLLENAVNENGTLDLSELDLSDFDGDVYIDFMKVKKNLHQCCQNVGGDLLQHNQKVGENLYQTNQKVGKNLWQAFQNVGEEFYNHKLKKNECWEEKRDCVIRIKKIDYNKKKLINKLESILKEIKKIKKELGV